MRITKYLWLLILLVITLTGAIGTISLLTVPAQAQFQVFLPIIFKAPYEPAKGVIVLNGLGESSCNDLNTLNAGWYYNNSASPSTGPGCISSGDRRFVPRLYNATSVLTDTAQLNAAITNAQDSGWLLGFVEPNLPWQGNTTPYEGARAWRALEQAIADRGLVLGDDIKLVAPAPNQWDPCYDSCATDPYGYQWVWYMVDSYKDQFCPTDRDSCKPHFDAMAWNYYRLNFYAPVASEFINFFTARRNEALARGLTGDIWVMEYSGACWNTDTQYPTYASHVMDQVTPWLASTTWVKRYAWFASRLYDYNAEKLYECSLFYGNGVKTSLGTKYTSYSLY